MARRDPREARMLGLWSASWLAVLLVAGLARLGDPTVQWPVLVIPVVWALLALRRRPDRHEPPDPDRPPPLAGRTDTVERPAVRPHRERPDRGW
jgi:hypothetical protein